MESVEQFFEKCLAVCGAIVAKIFGIDAILLLIWFVLICFDIITGVYKAKVTKQAILSSTFSGGVTKKLIPILLVTSFYLFSIAVEMVTGVGLSIASNFFALAYIAGETKSILENAQQAGVFLPKEMSKKVDEIFNTHNCKQDDSC